MRIRIQIWLDFDMKNLLNLRSCKSHLEKLESGLFLNFSQFSRLSNTDPDPKHWLPVIGLAFGSAGLCVHST
jgi:hypothetical protein